MSALALAPLTLWPIIYGKLVWSFCNLSAIKLNGYYACSIISEPANVASFVIIFEQSKLIYTPSTDFHSIKFLLTNKIKQTTGHLNWLFL